MDVRAAKKQQVWWARRVRGSGGPSGRRVVSRHQSWVVAAQFISAFEAWHSAGETGQREGSWKKNAVVSLVVAPRPTCSYGPG